MRRINRLSCKTLPRPRFDRVGAGANNGHYYRRLGPGDPGKKRTGMIELNYEERCRLSVLVMAVLDTWKVERTDQLHLLGMAAGRGRELARLRNGNPFPEDDAVFERARHILGIDDALQVIFPRNGNMSAFWLTNPNNRQFGRAPVEVMLDEGLAGMRRVWSHLDCTQDWD